MINVQVGLIYILNNGYMFKVESIHCAIPGIAVDEARGEIMFGNNSMKGYMDLVTGKVYDLGLSSFIATYLPPMMLPFQFNISYPSISPVVCECGGQATYNSMDPSCHSHWCAVNKQKEVRSGWIKYHT